MTDISPHKTFKENIQFITYVDQDNNLYIGQYIANKFDIPNRGGNIIKDGLKFIKVFQEDINNIIDKSMQTITPLYKDYNKVKEEIKKKDNNLKSIIYYHDKNDKYYLNREGYELSKKYDVEIEGTPLIIEERNCYTITLNQLNELKEKTEEYSWEEKNIEIKNKELIANLCSTEDNMYIPLVIFTKYKEEEDRKQILVNKELFISITKEEIEEIKELYSQDCIDLILIEKQIKRTK